MQDNLQQTVKTILADGEPQSVQRQPIKVSLAKLAATNWEKQPIKVRQHQKSFINPSIYRDGKIRIVPSRVRFVMAPNDHEASLHPPTRPNYLLHNQVVYISFQP